MSKNVKKEDVMINEPVLLNKSSMCLFVYEVQGANPNGNPDNDNAPRTLDDGTGYITSQCIKRKIRDLFSDHESAFFKEIQKEFNLNPEHYHVFESRNRGFSEVEVEDANKALKYAKTNPQEFLDRFIDVRLFGTTALGSNLEEKNEFIRTGCVTVTNGFSVSPVEVVEATLTKKAPLRGDLLIGYKKGKEVLEKGNGDIAPGAMKYVRHGVYVHEIHVMHNTAYRTRTTNLDIEILKKVLSYIFVCSPSYCRPIGSINPVCIWWTDYDKICSGPNKYKFCSSLKPIRKDCSCNPSLSLADYEFPIPTNEFGDVINLLD